MQKSYRLLALISTLILLVAGIAAAKDYVSAPFTKQAPVLDGVLDDEAWALAAEKGGKVFLNYNLHGQPTTEVKTEAYVAWDYDYLYIAFKAYQDPSSLIATIQTDGGNPWVEEDDVEVFIDTVFPAGTSYQQFVSNPNGIRANILSNWEAVAEVYDDHWVVEMAFSFDAFNMWPDVGDEWSINFARHVGYLSGAGDYEWFTFSPLVNDTFLDPTTLCLLEFAR